MCNLQEIPGDKTKAFVEAWVYVLLNLSLPGAGLSVTLCKGLATNLINKQKKAGSRTVTIFYK